MTKTGLAEIFGHERIDESVVSNPIQLQSLSQKAFSFCAGFFSNALAGDIRRRHQKLDPI